MAFVNVLCSNPRNKDINYANNSSLQRNVLLKTRPILQETIKDMVTKILPVTCIKVAELGCASGPNAFFPAYEIIDTITRVCQQSHLEPPELQVFLNDLPQNDFNTVFRSVPAFKARLKKDEGDLRGPCFIAGVPGSFYERLFPSRSIHFVHSSYSLHWLSRVPRGVETNKGHIYMSKSSSANVLKAYSQQFQMDFSKFLRLRSQEMIGGGRMLLSLAGRTNTDPTTKDYSSIWDVLTKSLFDLVAKGLVQESDIDSFNLPYYAPCKEEVKEIIEKEGSFNLDKIQVLDDNLDLEHNNYDGDFVFDKNKRGQHIANSVRAFTEPLLAAHFGDIIIHDLFTIYAQYADDPLSRDKTKSIGIVVLMTMK